MDAQYLSKKELRTQQLAERKRQSSIVNEREVKHSVSGRDMRERRHEAMKDSLKRCGMYLKHMRWIDAE